MTVRRQPPLPGSRLKDAQKVIFDGSLGGRIRSARPTTRGTAATAGSGTPSNLAHSGTIYRYEDGYRDVAEGDYLLDLSGNLWWRSGKEWRTLFQGSTQAFGGSLRPSSFGGVSHPIVGPSNVSLDGSVVAVVGRSNYWAGSDFALVGYANNVYGDSLNTVVGHLNSLGITSSHTSLNEASDGNTSQSSVIGVLNSSFGNGVQSSILGVLNSWEMDSTDQTLSRSILVGVNNKIWSASSTDIHLIGYNNQLQKTGPSGDPTSLVTLVGTNNFLQSGGGTTPSEAHTYIFGGNNGAVASGVERSHMIIVGDSNYLISSGYAGIVGQSSTSVNSHHTFLVGQGNNSYNSHYSAAVGTDNVLSGSGTSGGYPYEYPDDIIRGESFAFGRGNVLSGAYQSSAIGSGNTVTGEKSLAIGVMSTVTSDRSWVLGPEAGSLSDNETGILSAQRVVLSRSTVVGGSRETALALVSDAGNQIDLTVSDDGILGVDGNSVPAYVAVPTNATDPGVTGQVAADSTYIYVCVSTDTWVRAPLTTW